MLAISLLPSLPPHTFLSVANSANYSLLPTENNPMPGLLNTSNVQVGNSFREKKNNQTINLLVVGGTKRLIFHSWLYLLSVFDLDWFNLVWELKVCETSCSELWLKRVAGWMCLTSLVSSFLHNDPWYWWVSISCVGWWDSALTTG